MKKLKRIGVLLAAVMILCSSMLVNAEEGYTYNYDYWGDIQYSPDAYDVAAVFTKVELGLEKKFSSPNGMTIVGDMIYVCDTGNNRIIQMQRTDKTVIEVVRIIENFNAPNDSMVNTFNKPTDIAVSAEGELYIADQSNGRILKLDKDLNYMMQFTKPNDPTYDQAQDFLPKKVVIDTAGRVYCIATNVNKGLIKYENDGTFSGFVGATKVTYSFTDYIWKRFLSTKAQKAQLESFVPTEYDNLFMDHEGFIYVTTTTFSEADLDSGAAQAIRRLNMLGNDILVRNGNWFIIGDIYWGSGGGYSGPSLLTDITAMENDVYVAVDRVRGRIFGYDDQGRLLYAFGGNGNMDGYFIRPTAIANMGHDLFVLDEVDCSITLFTPTEFGQHIYNAIELFQDGFYEESGNEWREVLKLNGNYDLAFIGIGRSLLQAEQYKEAMEYFELKWDRDNYSRAFKQYRKEWVEENIVLLFVAAFVVLVLPLIIGKIKSIKHEIDTADIFKDKE